MGFFKKLFGKKSKKKRQPTILQPPPQDYETVLADIFMPEVTPEVTSVNILSDIIPPTPEVTPQRADPVIREAARSAVLKARKRKGRGATILNPLGSLEGTPQSALRPALRQASMLGTVG